MNTTKIGNDRKLKTKNLNERQQELLNESEKLFADIGNFIIYYLLLF